MKIDDWKESEIDDITLFVRFWKAENRKNPVKFELDMLPGDWFEEYIKFFNPEFNPDNPSK